MPSSGKDPYSMFKYLPATVTAVEHLSVGARAQGNEGGREGLSIKFSLSAATRGRAAECEL